jgi:hypothetical protein
MRLLVFCGTRKTIERFDMEPGWLILVPQYPPAQRQQILTEFCSTPDSRLAIQGTFMIHGWRAPSDTVVLFDTTWPYGRDAAESIQAAARVAHFPEWDIRGKTK